MSDLDLSTADRSQPLEPLLQPLPSVSHAGIEELPVAYREATIAPPVRKSNPNRGLWLGLGLASVAFVGASALVLMQMRSPSPVVSVPAAAAPSPTEPPDTLLNHYRYAEAPASDLASIGSDLKLRKAAAEAFRDMSSAAQRAGVDLRVISAFRSKQEQEGLYFGVKEQRNQSATERAQVSAPPGYSEHHTGYAVDLGDGKVPSTNLSVDFEKTEASRWLRANANRYSFELSFPEGNPQGVSYEPWHWRFVGDPQSLETFYKARQ